MENNDIKLDQYYFKRELDQYHRTLTPVKDYMEQASNYLSKRLGISKEDALVKVKQALKTRKLNNPIVRYNNRKQNNDLEEQRTKITDYIKEIKNQDYLTAPSLTVYKNRNQCFSIQGDFLDFNTKERSRYKKEAFKQNQLGNVEQYKFYDNLQKTKKVYNNSLSGSYASVSTILYNKSSHSTLTSMTRCVASIGNAISESIVTGNKHFRSYDLVYNYITTIVSVVDMKLVEIALEQYNLYKPTPDDVLKMLIKSSRWYWDSEAIHKDLKDYLSKLSSIELAAILYVNDMYHLRMYNDQLVRDLLTAMKESKKGLTDNPIYLTKSAEGIEILAKIINGELIKGMSVNYNDIDPNILDTLASTAKHICDVLSKYKLLFRAFLTTNVLPISIAYIKDMIRECIVLSDTDSTCGSYGEWVEWYYGENRFDQDAIALAAAIMTINTQSMDHNIKVFACNMSTDLSRVELLKMKNEFYWPVFTPSNVSKHYYADTLIQEGNVFSKSKLELKGAHFISSIADQEVVNQIHNYIKEVNHKLSQGEKIDLYYYVAKIADLERLVISKIDKGDISVFGNGSIKEAKSYKNDPDESAYWNHTLWCKVFEPKYGAAGNPPYMFVKIPTTINSKKKFTEFVDSIEDEDIKESFKNEMERVGKTSFTTFRPPMAIVGSKGIPVEIKNYIDIKRVVEDNLKSGYLFLETLGFYRKKDRLISELGY